VKIELLNGSAGNEKVLKAFEKESDAVSGHYKRCCKLKENTKVFLLIVEDDIVGFFAITIQMPKNPPSLEFWVAPEYIYIKEAHRGNAYSMYLLMESCDEIEKYLLENMVEGKYRLILRADIISLEGQKIINMFGHMMQSITNKHGLEYINISV